MTYGWEVDIPLRQDNESIFLSLPAESKWLLVDLWTNRYDEKKAFAGSIAAY